MSDSEEEYEFCKEDLEFTKKQIAQARVRVAQVKNQFYFGDEDKSPGEIKVEDISDATIGIVPQVAISDCQICVELSAKAILKMTGINPVERHDITLEDDQVSSMLGRLPEDADSSDDVPRVIFLTQFWERFYTLAKYGIPEENISSRDFMNASDAKRAINDAEFCIETAENIHDAQVERLGLELNDLDIW